jgi:hypothetical protein
MMRVAALKATGTKAVTTTKVVTITKIKPPDTTTMTTVVDKMEETVEAVELIEATVAVEETEEAIKTEAAIKEAAEATEAAEAALMAVIVAEEAMTTVEVVAAVAVEAVVVAAVALLEMPSLTNLHQLKLYPTNLNWISAQDLFSTNTTSRLLPSSFLLRKISSTSQLRKSRPDRRDWKPKQNLKFWKLPIFLLSNQAKVIQLTLR